MKLKLYVISTNLLCASMVFSCLAEDQSQLCDQEENVNFIINDTFNLADENTIFLHRWANFLHIKTKPITLKDESAFFLNKCQVTEEDLNEVERHLRSKKYIRDASVTYDSDNKVNIETWDNWSLLPTLEAGRKGGKNKISVGILDRNLFGLGIDAEVEYFNNDQRSGYKFDTQFPLYLGNNTNASIRLTNNDDGSSEAVFFQKKFVSFDTENAYKVGFDNFVQSDTQFENGIESNRYQHQKHSTSASWQWLHNNSAENTLRFGIGFTAEKHTFLNAFDITDTQTSALPKDREFNYPFVSINYVQKDYRKLQNINLINHIEDFNLGWNLTGFIGSDFSNNEGSPTAIWQSNLSKGIDISDNSLLFFNAEFEGEYYNDSTQKNRFNLKFDTQYLYKINNNWRAFFQNTNQVSKNQFLDSPIVLGGETGVRGFPLQYKHGDSSSKFTFEARYYPHINIYKLIEIGGAAFIDTGKVFGQSEFSQNQESSWLTSVGLGARFYSTHSSEARVIHLDLIKPVTSDSNVNSVEFRITTKHSF